MVTEENLEMAFDCMDTDGNGSLSVQEIRERLGDNISKETYVELLKQFNKNKDGQVKQYLYLDNEKIVYLNDEKAIEKSMIDFIANHIILQAIIKELLSKLSLNLIFIEIRK